MGINLITDCVKANEEAVREMMEELIGLVGDGEADLVPLYERLYNVFQREATEKEVETLEGYVYEYLEEQERKRKGKPRFVR